MNKRAGIFGSLLTIIALTLFVAAAQAQTTAFTYQGKLSNSGNLATANYDMQFRLFDNPNAGQGTQQGATFTNSSVAATGGIFTVQLDFGSQVFATGADLYLEIAVRPAGNTGGYTNLAPRQRITSTPYAIRALDAQKLGGVAAGQFVQAGDARLSDARQPAAGSNSYIQNQNTTAQAANFNISGDGRIGGSLTANGASSSTGVSGNSTNGDGVSGTSTSGYGVSGNSNNSYGVSGSSTSGTGVYAYSSSGIALQASGTSLLGGNVGIGIGVTAPAQTLDVNGRARIRSIPSGFATSGTVCFNQAGDLLQCGTSSLRLKSNVQKFSGGLDIIGRLRPISFNWKENGMSDIGLGAEEVARVSPSLVFTNSTGRVEGVKYERLNILLINAVKEQQAQIERQNQQIKQQQRQIDSLRRIAVNPNHKRKFVNKTSRF